MFVVFVMTECTVAGKEDIIGKAAQCILDTFPHDIQMGEDKYDRFITHISSQWNPLNPHDYLEWPVYNGPEAWSASCHFSSAIKQCLQPLSRFPVDLRYSYSPNVLMLILPALYYLTLCDHQFTLTDPTTNNAECVHRRILSDDVRRCSGLISWSRSNSFLIANKAEIKDFTYVESAASSMYECIYERGNWRHACGAEVQTMMQNLTKSFSNLSKLNPIYSLYTLTGANMCDLCKPETDLKTYNKLNLLRIKLIKFLLVRNQNPYVFTECQVVNFPLNQCHLRLIWREEVYKVFCHKVINDFIPVAKPHLPMCDIDDWITSVKRICKMKYDRFMDTASHIARCTNNEDELFPCYKGVFMDLLSWGLVTAGRVWEYSRIGSFGLGNTFPRVYSKTKMCSPRLYDHLRQTCRYGPRVVRLIQDLRTVLIIDAPAIFSMGLAWSGEHEKMEAMRQHVNHC